MRKVFGVLLFLAFTAYLVLLTVVVINAGARSRMLELTNHDRILHERDPLRGPVRRVCRYAHRHSREMAEKGYLFHSTEDQLRRVLRRYRWSEAGENVAVGSSLRQIERAFMASRSHRRNILDPDFRKMGAGVVREDDRIWLTVIYWG